MTGFICGPKIYKYKEVVFEINDCSGPWPLKKDGDPKKRAGRKFYALIKEFDALTKKKQEKLRIGGGCIRI